MTGLFRYCNDANAFRGHLRDFIITMKEMSGTDNAELYLEERKQEMQNQQKADFEAALKIPGMVKPSQLYVITNAVRKMQCFSLLSQVKQK